MNKYIVDTILSMFIFNNPLKSTISILRVVTSDAATFKPNI